MRLIDADKLEIKFLNIGTVMFPKIRPVIYLEDVENAPTIDAEPVEYQPISKAFARMITKSIAGFLSELQLDLPSIIYEDIESNLLKGKFADVECFVKNYIANNGIKTDEEAELG